MASARRRTRRDNDDDDDASVEDFIIDFAKEEKGAGGGIRVKPGQYKVRITGAKPTSSSEKGTPGLAVNMVFLDGKYKGKKFTETLWATPKTYSRFRVLLEAIGKKVPAKVNLVRIAAAVKGAELYVELDDDAREGYPTRSRVTFEGFIHEDDFDPDEDDDVDDDEETDDEDDEDDDDEEPAPRRRSKSAAKKPAKKKASKDDDEDDDLDDLDLDDF